MSSRPDWEAGPGAYNEIAGRYDEIPQTNRINAYMRRVSLRSLLVTFNPGEKVIELGCGTGEEALELAQRDIEVVALDPAEGMLRLGRKKAQDAGLGSQITFLHGHAHDLSRLGLERYGPYDGAYASFSLAYEPELRSVAVALDQVLRPEAPLLASLPSRVCLVEFITSLLLGRPSYAGQRLQPWYGHRVGSHRVPIHAYTPREITRVMSPYFKLVRIEGLPFLVPPAYANRWFAALGAMPEVVESLDAVLRTRFPFRFLGDHFLAELRHRGDSDLRQNREL